LEVAHDASSEDEHWTTAPQSSLWMRSVAAGHLEIIFQNLLDPAATDGFYVPDGKKKLISLLDACLASWLLQQDR
jgi:hypothetical protein